MQNPDLPPGAAVFLAPGKWQWTTPALPSSFTPEAGQSWLAQMAGLAVRAERTPPPTAVAPNWLERQNPTTVAFLIAIIFLFGTLFVLFACCMLPALTLILLNPQ
jgi:hypothetical protein